MADRDYRDDDLLSEAIADVWADALSAGQSWSRPPPRNPEARDYAMARADRLEVENELLRIGAADLANALDNLLKLVAPSNVYGERAHSRDARTALAKYRAVVNRG